MTDTHPVKTPLYRVHTELGARMTDFAGFEMPVQYSGIIDEHKAVRHAAGVFDVSHMGEVLVTGPNALAFIQRLVTNDASKLVDGKAMYTVMCRPDGGIVDDLLVYRLSENRYMLVINAACIEGDMAWIREQNGVGAVLKDISERIALIAVQGPEAFNTVGLISPVSLSQLPFYHFLELNDGSFWGSEFCILSHTGYTGEKGLEIYCDPDKASLIWEKIMDAGRASGIKPAGLGARDTLRLEAGYCLYGNDITTDTNPLEAGLGWLTKFDKGDFIGRAALQKVKEEGMKRRLVGFVAEERGIPRRGDAILASDGEEIGTVTSGTQSPILKRGIGMGYVKNDPSFTEPGARLAVSNRTRSTQVMVRRPPFHKIR